MLEILRSFSKPSEIAVDSSCHSDSPDSGQNKSLTPFHHPRAVCHGSGTCQGWFCRVQQAPEGEGCCSQLRHQVAGLVWEHGKIWNSNSRVNA